MRTIIHIGQHKTGTTSLQHYLQSQREPLARAGLYVPDTLLGFDNPSHFLLNVYALDPQRESTAKLQLRETTDPAFFEGLGERLQEAIAGHYQQARSLGCRDILWTNEGLYLLDSDTEYQRLRQLFVDFSSHIACVCCFRDRDSFLASYRRQLLDQGMPLSTDPSSYRYVEADSWLVDYTRKRSLLSGVFDEVLELEYQPQDMIRPFMTALGYAADPTQANLRLNTSNEP